MNDCFKLQHKSQTKFILQILTFITLGGFAASAQDPVMPKQVESYKEIALKVLEKHNCMSCHGVSPRPELPLGETGKTVVPPEIAGNLFADIDGALFRYSISNWKLVGKKSAYMEPIAASLSQKERIAIAWYFSILPKGYIEKPK